jgi:hypothetical protein
LTMFLSVVFVLLFSCLSFFFSPFVVKKDRQ